ncbi:MAG TPA: MFS transporter [Acetobacteraceae bacterium]|nr:MFS transporter [Acetobacteraceae bacterium]
MSELEQRTMAKVSARLVPFLMLCYFVAYLDRVNVGFAGLMMRKDLALSNAAFGLASGIFFLTYFVFEVPSNLFLHKFGARKWIARIMLTWGLVSGADAFVTGEHSFYVVRLLLGAAEAGFFPGIIFYLTLWFPGVYRGRIVGWFMAAIPASTVIGAPVSSLLLYLDGVGGLKGWQWLFIAEAIPALILSVVVFFYLTDRPADATWLAPEERNWLADRLDAEERQRMAAEHISVGQALRDWRVLTLALVYFGGVATNYGVAFWLPQIIQSFGALSKFEIGLITAIPYLVGAITMVLWAKRSDRKMERKLHVAIPLVVAAVGIGGAGLVSDPVLKMALLSIAGFGVFANLPVFWTLPAAFLSGASAAAGIAIINALGNLSGFFGPYAMGWIKDTTGSFSGGLLLIAALALIACVAVLILRHDTRLEHAPAPAAE